MMAPKQLQMNKQEMLPASIFRYQYLLRYVRYLTLAALYSENASSPKQEQPLRPLVSSSKIPPRHVSATLPNLTSPHTQSFIHAPASCPPKQTTPPADNRPSPIRRTGPPKKKNTADEQQANAQRPLCPIDLRTEAAAAATGAPIEAGEQQPAAAAEARPTPRASGPRRRTSSTWPSTWTRRLSSSSTAAVKVKSQGGSGLWQRIRPG